MPGRAQEAERAVEPPVEHPLDRVRDRPRRLQGRGVGMRSGLGVGIETMSPAGRGGDRGDVLGGVHAEELLARRVAGAQELEAAFEAFAPDPLPERDQAFRPLRMPRPGVVLQEDGIVVEPDLHCLERISLAAAVSFGSTSNTSPTIP
jgi:hypothetical protein